MSHQCSLVVNFSVGGVSDLRVIRVVSGQTGASGPAQSALHFSTCAPPDLDPSCGPFVFRRGSQVVRPSSAKALSAVRFRPAPPAFASRCGDGGCRPSARRLMAFHLRTDLGYGWQATFRRSKGAAATCPPSPWPRRKPTGRRRGSTPKFGDRLGSPWAHYYKADPGRAVACRACRPGWGKAQCRRPTA